MYRRADGDDWEESSSMKTKLPDADIIRER